MLALLQQILLILCTCVCVYIYVYTSNDTYGVSFMCTVDAVSALSLLSKYLNVKKMWLIVTQEVASVLSNKIRKVSLLMSCLGIVHVYKTRFSPEEKQRGRFV